MKTELCDITACYCVMAQLSTWCQQKSCFYFKQCSQLVLFHCIKVDLYVILSGLMVDVIRLVDKSFFLCKIL